MIDRDTRGVGRILDSYANPRLRLGFAINVSNSPNAFSCLYEAMLTRKTFAIA